MKKITIIIAFAISVFACETSQKQTQEQNEPTVNLILKDNKSLVLNTIGFGSCNHQQDPQDYWQSISHNNPDLWIWLGDNIYADTEDMTAMKGMYDTLKANEFYHQFYTSTPIIGVWDDHDYGVNDGDKNYSQKKASRDLMLEFLDVPKENPVWKREGAYSAYSFGEGEKSVKVILLDARYFRDPLEKNESGASRYVINETGDILGDAQWKWFEEELNNADEKLILVGSGIQFIAEEQGYEKWANFPQARKKFFEVISASGKSNIVLLSGDRHISEFAKIDLDNIDEPIYEFTSSGLTHTWSEAWDEQNKYRVGELIINKSFGVIKIDWDKNPIEVTYEMRDPEDKLLQELTLKY
ncbi:MAG: alkaline phosphatase [Thalassobius sp.]|nr:alkaline phosphatase [Thalassovita sp.]